MPRTTGHKYIVMHNYPDETFTIAVQNPDGSYSPYVMAVSYGVAHRVAQILNDVEDANQANQEDE